MKRLLVVFLVFLIQPASTGCGNIFVRGALAPSGTVQTASGIVSVVQFTNNSSNGTLIQVTIVTFLVQGTSSTFSFCGDQRSQFPMNQFVRTNFRPGPPCADIVTVVIGFN